ncbi:MAG TPA: hypothetical protein GX708_18705 [Gallicola sp.]|nr:hypothetical protein [Gallicola sp.]
MNIKELKEKLQNDGFIDFGELHIKTYLPLIHKKILVDNICTDLIEYDENGLAFVNEIQKKISISVAVLINFCDIEILEEDNMDDVIETLDLLFETGKYSEIEEYIGNDLDELKLAIETEIENIKLRNNSLESIVAKGLNKIINTLPNDKQIKKLIAEIPKQINKIKPEQLGLIKDMVKQQNIK